jgi:hypothetical protein
MAFTSVVAQANRSSPTTMPALDTAMPAAGISPVDSLGIGVTNASYRLTSSNWPTGGTAGSGTVSVSAGSTTITGSGTSFTSQLAPGRIIEVAGQQRQVVSIASNTSLEVNAPFPTTLSGQVGVRYDSVEWTLDRDDLAGAGWVEVSNGMTIEGALARGGAMPGIFYQPGGNGPEGPIPLDHAIQLRVRYRVLGTLRFGVEREILS